MVREQAEAVLAIAKEQGLALYLAMGTLMLGWSLAMNGNNEEGVRHLQEGLDKFMASGAGLFLGYFKSLLGEVYGRSGLYVQALRELDGALESMNRLGDRFWEAESLRLKGEFTLALSADKHAEAEASFRQALDIACRQGAKSLELRAVMSLSRLWRMQGKKDGAHQLLGEVYGWFTEGFETADLREAKALLEESS